jgi:electron transfer flavoprotein alpha subunit
MSGCSDGSCGDGKERLPPGMLSQYDLDLSTAEGVLVWLEVIRDPEPRFGPGSLEILGKVRSICDGRIFGIVFGDAEIKPLYGTAFSCGVDTLYHIKDKRLAQFHPEAYCEAAAELAERIVPAAILMSATPRGREFAPRLAAALGAGLTADCTELSADGRTILMTRPAFGGNLIATIVCGGFPQMATVRPGAFPPPVAEKERKGTVIYRQYSGSAFKDVISSEPVESESTDITKAKILISLGNGIRDRSTAELAESVASKLGGAVSCSRALVDRGWFPQSRQVGQSGKIISPDVYIAFGISGSIQHKAGIFGAKRIIAVNTDPDAPIREIADVFIVGDAHSVLKELDGCLGA